MTMLFNVDWETTVPLHTIERIVRGPESRPRKETYHVTLTGGSVERIAGFEHRRLVATPMQMIPAQPGTEALSIGFDDDGHDLNRVPVIAWALCFDGSIRIVTPAGVDDGHLWREGQGYVLMPDGTVHSVSEYLDETRFDTLDAYVAHEAAEHRKKVEPST